MWSLRLFAALIIIIIITMVDQETRADFADVNTNCWNWSPLQPWQVQYHWPLQVKASLNTYLFWVDYNKPRPLNIFILIPHLVTYFKFAADPAHHFNLSSLNSPNHRPLSVRTLIIIPRGAEASIKLSWRDKTTFYNIIRQPCRLFT